MAAPERYRVYAMLNFCGVPLTRTLGYTPAWTGLGMDLPKDAFLQWVSWVMSPRFCSTTESCGPAKFSEVQGRVCARSACRMIPGRRGGGGVCCVQAFTASSRDHHGDTAETRALQIGHLGFFRPNIVTRCGAVLRNGSRRA